MDIASNQHFPACAACQCLCRNCGPDCVLAPFFPAGSEADFTRVDKLFGAQKIADMINTLHPHLRRIATESAVYEARAHVDCPRGGALCVAKALASEILCLKSELRSINKKLLSFRAAKAANAAKMTVQELQEASSPSQSSIDQSVLCGGEESATNIVSNGAVHQPSFSSPSSMYRKVVFSEESLKSLVEDELRAMEAVHEAQVMTSSSLQVAIRKLHELIAQQEEEGISLANCNINSD